MSARLRSSCAFIETTHKFSRINHEKRSGTVKVLKPRQKSDRDVRPETEFMTAHFEQGR